jgi:hypothetical protein
MTTNSIYIILIFLGTLAACNNRLADQKEIMTESHQDSINKFLEWLVKEDTTIKFGSSKNGYVQNFTTGQYEKMTMSEMLLSNDFVDLDISDNNFNLSIADTLFIRQQRIHRNKFIVPQTLDSLLTILPFKTIEGDSDLRIYYKKISIPLFSKDYKTIFIEIHNICRPTCGYGQFCIFTKDNLNNWRLWKENVSWEN